MDQSPISWQQFNEFISKHSAQKPIRGSVIDKLDTVEDLHAWITFTEAKLTKQRRYLGALRFALKNKDLTWGSWHELTDDAQFVFYQDLDNLKLAQKKLVLVEQRTWEDLEGPDAPPELVHSGELNKDSSDSDHLR